MRESGIGRVLVASLHQAIGDVLPMRLGFYESFLAVQALRDGTIGIAPLSAVLSFLRQEEGDAYERVVTRAGDCAAEWTVESMTPIERSTIASAPGWLRARLILRVARQLVRRSCDRSRASARLRGGVVRIELRNSVFCQVREPVPVPLCGFYAAAFSRLLTLLDLPATTTTESCRGRDESSASCVLLVTLSGTAEKRLAEEPAA